MFATSGFDRLGRTAQRIVAGLFAWTSALIMVVCFVGAQRGEMVALFVVIAVICLASTVIWTGFWLVRFPWGALRLPGLTLLFHGLATAAFLAYLRSDVDETVPVLVRVLLALAGTVLLARLCLGWATWRRLRSA